MTATAPRVDLEPHAAPGLDQAWEAGDWVEVEPVRLAPVIVLDDHRPTTPRTAGTVRRRRLAALGAAVAVALLLALVAGARLADAAPSDPVAGTAVVEPGETLWDVAVAHSPAGSDPRDYLLRIRELNGIDGGAVPAWTVVLLPRP